MLDKDKIKSSLSKKLSERILDKYKEVSTKLFEDNANLDRMRDKIDSLRKEISDLEIRRRNTENEVFKKTTSNTIENKRAQIRTLQKSIKQSQLTQTSSKQV